MKIMTILLLASTVSLTLVSTAKAGDVVLSPRAQANQIARAKGINNDPNLVSGNYLGAAQKTANTAPRVVVGTPVKDMNLAGANYLGASSKNVWRELSGH